MDHPTAHIRLNSSCWHGLQQVHHLAKTGPAGADGGIEGDTVGVHYENLEVSNG